nr:arf-GAP with Rho-GAP domain, ANK repeat and PH domain-containing protein 3-like [Oncorhynchus nerka]
MYVVMATMDGNTDVETLLAAIHLERYLKTFRQSGFLLARDLSHLDNGALIQLGVTATGHRKRILRLVQHIQRATNQNQSIPEPLEPLLDRCQSESDINSTPIQSGGPRSDQGGGTGAVPFEAFRNSSVPNIPSMLMKSGSEQQQYNGNVVIKPVPKPRTVFYIHKTEPARFLSCPASLTPPDPLGLTLTRKPSQESLCFTILEGLASGEFNTDTVVVGPAPNPASNPTPTPALRHSLSLRERRLSNSSDSGGPLPPVPPRLNRGTPPAMFSGPTSTPPSSGGRTEQNQDQCMTTPPPSSPCNYDDTGFPSSTTSPPGSPMEMVSNEIYCGTKPGTAASSGRIPCNAPQTPPRPEIHTSPERNSTLSNNSCESSHGVPMEDPEEEISPYCETVFQTRRPLQHSEAERTNSEGKTGMTRKEEEKHREDHGTPKLSWAQSLSHALHSESQGYSTVGEAAPPPRCLSLPSNLYPSEPDEDQTISPYASYTSLSEQTEPIICGWLDKLSPQGNYVFQKRYVKFDGKNLLYFGSEKDPYPKGVIPLAAIQMARMAKDNKFEIVTSHRTFVFRADNEVQRHQWCSTLQGRVKEQLVFGRPHFGPGSHCQRSGPLELKGTKSKVYVAINTEQVWLYKNEQCFRTGIGITLIEARGATIRGGKGKSFDLITPYKTFSFTAESERDKRDWMEAVQESIAETLSDYEVAEKIWSNRFNKLCADCQAVNPDWASINLCVVICKNCAGQHRGLGTMVSKVQSLKLDTSVWSNEIVQLFIMLGNDRANEFWAARLSPADGLDCDATPDQRKEFIIHKYREGRYRHPHPNFNTQEELLKVLCTAVTQQNLLKTVTQIFTEAEAVRSRLAASNGYDKHLSQEYSRSQDTSGCVICSSGLGHEGIYRKNGAASRIKLLMEEFRNDARNVKLRIGDNFIEDVTDVLKRFFREIDDPIFMADLHQLWKEAVRTAKDKNQRLDRYKEIIRSLPRVNRTTLAALISHLYRVQKCADLNQMCTKNLSLLFAPSLFQTDGKGEHEVKIVEDLIDNYLYVFDIDEEQQTQIELELSLITTWKDTQLSQAGDLIIEVYLEKKMADSCITLKVSPTMGAEELTNQVLYMRNVPAGEKDVWLTFEAIYEGQLERPLHPKEKVLEQALQWCKMADPSSAYLVVKRVPRGEGINILTAYKSEIMKMGVLKCREDPPKLLHGKVFQEHTFQIKDHKLLLLRDKKSIKPEKEWPLKSMKIYMGIRKKLKPPTRWGFTLMMEKQQLYLCCFCESDLWDWVTNFLKAQNDDPRPPVLRRHSSSDISKQKFGTMPLIPIRGDGHESNSTMLSANQTLRKLHARRTLSMFFPMKVQQDSFAERPDSTEPEPPEPLYEEVGDFGLQVLKSLETSFLSNNTSETQVPLGPRKTCSLDRMIGLNPVHSLGPGGEGLLPPAGSLDTLVLGGGGDLQESPQPAPRRRQQHRPCTPSQELLLQELSSVFTKKTDKEDKLPGEKNVI